MLFPSNLKLIFGIFVDAKVVQKRKYYLIAFGIISSASMFIQGLDVIEEAEYALVVIFISFFGNSFTDCVLDSLTIQEGRRDQKNG
jgi:hypothetical protein